VLLKLNNFKLNESMVENAEQNYIHQSQPKEYSTPRKNCAISIWEGKAFLPDYEVAPM